MRYDFSDDVMKTKRDTGLIYMEEIVYAESNGHVIMTSRDSMTS